MEVFRELTIQIDADRMTALADQIERSPPEGWARDRVAEGRILTYPGTRIPGPTFCFTCVQFAARPAATLILAEKGQGTYFASNIIPSLKHQLTRGEYNAVLEDFYQRAIQPYAGPERVTAQLTDWRADLEHWMSRESADRLRAFSSLANKGTGSSHPADRERWNDFVLAAHQDKCRMTAVDLRRWLIEVEGWSPEVAYPLAEEYEYGRELLAFAEGRRSA